MNTDEFGSYLDEIQTSYPKVKIVPVKGESTKTERKVSKFPKVFLRNTAARA